MSRLYAAPNWHDRFSSYDESQHLACFAMSSGKKLECVVSTPELIRLADHHIALSNAGKQDPVC